MRVTFFYFNDSDDTVEVHTCTLTTMQEDLFDARHSLETMAIALAAKFSKAYDQEVFWEELY